MYIHIAVCTPYYDVYLRKGGDKGEGNDVVASWHHGCRCLQPGKSRHCGQPTRRNYYKQGHTMVLGKIVVSGVPSFG